MIEKMMKLKDSYNVLKHVCVCVFNWGKYSVLRGDIREVGEGRIVESMFGLEQ